MGAGRVVACSAGSQPKGTVHPLALELLQQQGLPIAAARSKSWNEIIARGAPTLDLVITVCDSAAGEVCPVWPGQPLRAHWGIDDPAATIGSATERRAAFRRTDDELEARIRAFLAPPTVVRGVLPTQQELQRIGDEYAGSRA
jgi:arsenate reductase